MRIDGIVVAVGQHYADTLAQALPVWLDTLDSLTIVTDEPTNNRDGTDFLFVFDNYRDKVNLHRTNIFYRYGAHFNKGAALSEAFYHLNPKDFVLNFDADIIPPSKWRKIAEPLLEVGNLYGCKRHYEHTTNPRETDSTFPNLWGYFHLWNVADPRSWVRPVYPVDCGHAGNYDHTFMRRWAEHHRKEIPFTVEHIGAPRANWFGQAKDAEQRMARLHELGLHKVWQTNEGKIEVPEPERNTILYRREFEQNGYPENIMKIMRDHCNADPFSYTVTVK